MIYIFPHLFFLFPADVKDDYLKIENQENAILLMKQREQLQSQAVEIASLRQVKTLDFDALYIQSKLINIISINFK
jgi:hypothetical protein